MSLSNRRGSRDNSDWVPLTQVIDTTMSTIHGDAEANAGVGPDGHLAVGGGGTRGNGTGGGAPRASDSPYEAGTPSHDHPANGVPWRLNDSEPFPSSRHGRSQPFSIGRFLSSRLGRNIMIATALLLGSLSLLKATRPETLKSGVRYFTSAVSGGKYGELGELMSLDERLTNLLERPALEQWEMEMQNRHSCPFYTYSRNTYFFHDGKTPQWEGINRQDVIRYRNAMVSYLKDVEASGVPLVWTPEVAEGTGYGEGGGGIKRGMIITGGDGPGLERMKLGLNMIREVLKSKIPIELYHFPDELQDPATREGLEAQGVTLRQLEGKNQDGKNWHIKNAAFVQTEFTEFIYIDSDNIPLVDPAVHFDSYEYRTSGSVFWPDLYKDHPDNAIWRILGHTCTDDHWPAEAGQIVFDKRGNGGLNLAVLHLSNHMMTNPDMYGDLSYGDKDTFRFAFYALGLPYQQAPKIFATCGGYQTQNGESSPDYFCGHSLIQWGTTPWAKRNDPTYHPPPAFLHVILGKHRSNLQANKLWSHIKRPRLDGITEPTLVRTPYEFTGDCFAIFQKGPDGLEESENSMRDGQGVLEEELWEAFGGPKNPVYRALKEMAQPFVDINTNRD